MAMITQRIKRDFEMLKNDYNNKLNPGFFCCFDIFEDNWKTSTTTGSLSNPRNFTILIKGPEKTPYQGGLFEINVKLDEKYPMDPPKITMLSEIYHPNIKKSSICLSTLKDAWSPALPFTKVLLSLYSLLEDPNPDDPLDPNAARDFKENKARFEEIAIAATQRSLEKINAKKAQFLST